MNDLQYQFLMKNLNDVYRFWPFIFVDIALRHLPLTYWDAESPFCRREVCRRKLVTENSCEMNKPQKTEIYLPVLLNLNSSASHSCIWSPEIHLVCSALHLLWHHLCVGERMSYFLSWFKRPFLEKVDGVILSQWKASTLLYTGVSHIFNWHLQADQGIYYSSCLDCRMSFFWPGISKNFCKKSSKKK